MGGLSASVRHRAAPALVVAALLAIASAVTSMSIPARAAPAPAASLLENGGFTTGTGGVPTGWRTEAWARDLSRFGWEVTPEGTGTVSITNMGANDARWCQQVPVEPGASYRVSTRVKTRDIGALTAGALVAIEPRIADSRDLRGTQDWQELEVVAQAGEMTTWDVCLRLGSYANLNTGTAWFTDVTLVQVGRRPAAATQAWRRWWASWSRGRALAVGLPLLGGLLLGYGLGIGRRRR
jgi:hypothetical protein